MPRTERQKRNVFWFVPHETLSEIVKAASTFGDLLRVVDMFPIGGNIKTVKHCLTERNISYAHILEGRGSNRGIKRGGWEWSSESLFTVDSSIARGSVRRRILRDNLLPYRCSECNSDPFWRGKSLVLVLDHINGVRNDHRLENLRFVCPNCNSQLDTHCGRNNAFDRGEQVPL